MNYIHIVTLLALMQYFYFGFCVARARAKYGVYAPAELAVTAGIGLGLAQLCFQPGQLALAGGQLRARQRLMLRGIHRVKPCQYLPFANLLAFFNQHFQHPPRHLGRDSGHTPRHHIAGGIQYRGRASRLYPIKRLGNGGLHLNRRCCPGAIGEKSGHGSKQ